MGYHKINNEWVYTHTFYSNTPGKNVCMWCGVKYTKDNIIEPCPKLKHKKPDTKKDMCLDPEVFFKKVFKKHSKK